MKPPTIRQVLRHMLEELESNRLEVCKVPSRRESSDGRSEGGYIRVVCSTNAEWYRRFCANYMRHRRGKMRTFIKRCDTIKALNRMLAGDRETEYAKRLMRELEALRESQR